jgi:hypothetical protein
VSATTSAVDLEPGSFDVMRCDYIERSDPSASFGGISALRSGGYLAISTGTRGLGAPPGRFWHLIIPPKHLYYFTSQTMIRLQDVGFLMVRIDWPGKGAVDFAVWKATVMLLLVAAPPCSCGQQVGVGHSSCPSTCRHHDRLRAQEVTGHLTRGAGDARGGIMPPVMRAMCALLVEGGVFGVSISGAPAFSLIRPTRRE